MAADVSINFEIDVLGIADAIKQAISNPGNREGFVKNLMETAFYKAGQQY